MDLAALFHRIGYGEPAGVNEKTLRQLHRRFVNSVPFENLDIHLGRRIVLDESLFFDKIVRRGRGGFCYELNGLFGAALRQIGFDVHLLAGRVFDADGEMGRSFGHLLLLVNLDRPWIADVGFGEWFVEPIRLDDLSEQLIDRTSYCVHRNADHFEIKMKEERCEWRTRYAFTLAPHELTDFSAACDQIQADENSFFRKHRICTRPTSCGQVTLYDDRLIVTTPNKRTEKPLSGEADFADLLRLHFDISL